MSRSSAAAWTWACALAFVLPAYAQDDAAQVVPTEELATEAPSGETAAEAPPAEEAPAEAAATEEAPAEEAAPTEEAAADEPAEPTQLYAGVDYVVSTLALSSTVASGATTEFDSGMYRGRIGMRALEAVGLELQLGVDNSDDEPGSVKTKNYYGLFLVPTATVFEIVELAFPVGYAQSTFGSSAASEDFRSIAYGIDAELPLRSFGESMPDLRFTAGWMVYYQKSDARAYGANVGVRYDFKTGGFSLGNPFSGIAKLWPFGGDEEKPAE